MKDWACFLWIKKCLGANFDDPDFYLFIYVEVELIYNVMLVSGVQHSNSVIYREICIYICVCVCVVDFVFQWLTCVQFFATLWTAACQASLSFTNSQSLLRFISIELVMLSKHFILYHPLLLLLSIFPSIRVFSSELDLCMRWEKYWSFSISPSNEYSGLISFRTDWFDLLAVQGTLKSLL